MHVSPFPIGRGRCVYSCCSPASHSGFKFAEMELSTSFWRDGMLKRFLTRASYLAFQSKFS